METQMLKCLQNPSYLDHTNTFVGANTTFDAQMPNKITQVVGQSR